MKRMHLVLVATALSTAALIVGCGGGAPSVDSPTDDAMPDDPSEGMTTDASDAAPMPPSDGIIRDADGDGQPDDEKTGCDGLSKTKCEITSGCAWSGDDKCVEASGSMM